MIETQFKPDYAVHPGSTLSETLESFGMLQVELAERIGRTPKTISGIINGKEPITPETAIHLERVLKVPARYWINLQRNYQLHLAHIQEQEELSRWVDWLVNFPVKDLVKKGWIHKYEDKVQQLKEVLKFFSVASPETWEIQWGSTHNVAFRQSKAFMSSPGASAAWLQKGRLMAHDIKCEPFLKPKFREALTQIRALTVRPPEEFCSKMVSLSAQAGVAVCFVPEVQGCRASGATWWLSPQKAAIFVNLRYKTNDQFWFSFFHESAHVLKHGRKDIFIDSFADGDEREKEANDFAANFLIPPKNYRGFIASGRIKDCSRIRSFAKELGIVPGIVVGRLQHDKLLDYRFCNSLKAKYKWNPGKE